MGQFVDLTGCRFSRLLVLERDMQYSGHNTAWRCLCDCGTIVSVVGGDLKAGKTKSCGCLKREQSRKRCVLHNSQKDGHSKDRLYQIWADMKTRCLNSRNPFYHCYGGRGIRVCDEWIESYDAFKKWAIKHGYDDSLTIDRINVDGDYTPDNCRFVSQKVQANNRRNNRFLTYNGKTHTISEWSKITGIPYGTLSGRILCGWQEKRAIEEPVKKKNKIC